MTWARRAGVALILMGLMMLAAPTVEAGRCFRLAEGIGIVCDGRVAAEPEPFSPPVERSRSLLDRTIYAYLDDNVYIYPEPDESAQPLYTLGEGFLYVTLNREVESNGQRWYEMNAGEFVPADSVRLVEVPAFRGVEVALQPERPFGWLVQDVVPSHQPDGEPDHAYAELERFDFFQVYDAVVGEDNWIWYQLENGGWIRQTYVSLIDVHPPPDDVAPGEFWVEVDLYEQTFAAYEGRRMVYAGLISSGLNRWPTHEGLFQVWSRYRENKMSGAEGKVDYYFIEDVPYIMYFDRLNEIALHGAYWHDRFGYKHSHGCVNMPPRDAEWIYYWSAQAPNDLWVWVHTSDPHSYFSRFSGKNG